MSDYANQPANDEDDFERHFAAAAAHEGGPADADEVDAAAPAAPAPQAGAEPSAQQHAVDQAGGQAQPPSPEELQRKLDEILARERANAGRTSALARENNALRQQLAELATRQQQAAQAPAASSEPADGDDADVEDALSEAPDLKRGVDRLIARRTAKLQQEIEAARAQLAAVHREVQETQQSVQPLREREIEQVRTQTQAEMDRMFGNTWRDEVRSQRFAEWLDRQPAPVQQLARTGLTPAETTPVLRLYYAENGLVPQAPTAPTNRPGQAGVQRTAPAGSSADRLRMASGIPSRPASVARAPAPADDDFDAHFTAAFRRAG